MIVIDDLVKTSTFRKVISQKQTSVSSQKVRTLITLKITSIDFDSKEGIIRISGRNVEKNKNINLGAYHTSEIAINRKLTLTKPCWDFVTLDRLKKCCDVNQKANLAAIVMQQGLCHICLITSNLTLVRAKIEKSFPKKKGNFAGNVFKEAKTKFFKQILDALLVNIDMSVVKCIVVASPGFLNQELKAYIAEQVSKFNSSGDIIISKKKGGNNSNLDANVQMKLLAKNLSILLLTNVSNGHVQALDEVLSKKEVLAKIKEVSAMEQITTLELFHDTMRKNPNQAVYALKYVEYCLDEGAVKTLLVSDTLFRADDIKTRRYYVDLVEKCKTYNTCKVVIYSSLHATGKKLDAMTGIAAILRYPILDLDELVGGVSIDVHENIDDSEYYTNLTEEQKNFEVFF